MDNSVEMWLSAWTNLSTGKRVETVFLSTRRMPSAQGHRAWSSALVYLLIFKKKKTTTLEREYN